MAEIEISELSEDLRELPSITKFAKDGKISVDNLAKSYGELEKHLGGSIKIPGEGASVEDIQKFRKALGVPEKVEDYGKYDVGDPEDIAEIIKAAHEEGLSKKQLDRLMKVSGERSVERQKKFYELKRIEGETTLKNKWGDKYESNKNDAIRAMQELAPESIKKRLIEDPSLGNDPDMIELFQGLWHQMKEAAFHKPSTSLTAEDIEQKMVDIQSDPAFNDRGSPKWEHLHKELTRLYKLKYPE